MDSKLQPLRDRVIVKRVETPDRTRGGIIIPDIAKEKPVLGEVLAVGPGRRDDRGKLIPLEIKAGDRVMFGKWSGAEVDHEGQPVIIMEEADILAIVLGE